LKSNRIETIAKQFEVPVFSKGSIFPTYYATHEVGDPKVLDHQFLLSSDSSGISRQSYETDRFLGSTRYVFFALGKGYLKFKNSIGLLYDPFVLAKQKGANIVMNDLLYVLAETDILYEFCDRNLDLILGLLRKHHPDLKTKKSKDETERLFVDSFSQRKNLLIADSKDEILFGNSFELILRHLPATKSEELKTILNTKIVLPNTIQTRLDSEIRKAFMNDKDLLSSFFDESKEERIIELRIPNKHEITNGLIGVYCS
jgi:hypothetical protein